MNEDGELLPVEGGLQGDRSEGDGDGDGDGDEERLETQDDTHYQNSDQEVRELLSSWAARSASGKRTRAGADVHGHQVRVQQGYFGMDRARKQHLSNLVAMLRRASATRDGPGVLQVAAALLQAEPAGNLTRQWQYRHQEAAARLSEALLAGYRVLVELTPPPATYEQLKRYLRLLGRHQPSSAGRAAVTLELAALMERQGELEEAYGVVITITDGGYGDDGAIAAEKAALCGSLRLKQWIQAMEATSAALGGSRWDPYIPDSKVTSKAGRSVKDLIKEAEKHLWTALRLRPSSSEIAFALVQALIWQGKHGEATQLALRLCQNAPLDADAHALRIMLLLSSASRKHTSAPKDSPIGVTTEVAHRCCTILQLAHGASEEAVALLVDPLAEIGGAAPDEAYVAALCKFLDVAPSPLSAPDSLSSKVCMALVARLSAMATAVCEVMGSMDGDRSEEVRSALSSWKLATAPLHHRGWWLESHLHVSETAAPGLMQQLQTHPGTSDAAAALVIVAAAIGGAAPDQSTHAACSKFISRLLQLMEEAGCEVQSTAAAVQLVGGAFSVRSDVASAATLVSAALAAAAFARNVGKPWKPSAVWRPVPMGGHDPQLGPIAALPRSWWSAFPYFRRRRDHPNE